MADIDCQNTFIETLHLALRHLYDPVHMRRSALLGLFGLAQDRNPAEALRTLLKNAIAALQVDDCDPCAPGASRYYQVLYSRYVQQFNQRDVAHQLHISPRQLRREQARAVEALAEVLRSRHGLPRDVDHLLASPAQEAQAEESGQTVDQEMSWLEDSLGDQIADARKVMDEALQLAKMVAQPYRVHLDAQLANELPPLAVASTVLKQIVLNLATTAIHGVPDGGTVTMQADRAGDDVVITVEAQANSRGVWQTPEQDGLEMAERLVKLFQGRLIISTAEGPLSARLTLPSAETLNVLAIEDNLDTLQLWTRYVQGSRFHITGLCEPQHAIELAAELKPRLILLDVMMPGTDGWELLGQLRNHPATNSIPVIVCTVLPQKELALCLGACDFVRKPASRPVFLAALARQIGAAAPL